MPTDNRILHTLRSISTLNMLVYGLFITGLTVLLEANNTNPGLVNRMSEQWDINKVTIGAGLTMGAFIMAIAPTQNWRLVGLIPFLLFVIGAWTVSYNRPPLQGTILYTVNLLVIFWKVVIHAGTTYETP